MFSQTAEYAVRAVVWLAQHKEGGPVGNQTIAEGTQVSVSYLAKILQALAKAELLSSRRGAGGGFELISDIGQLTVLDVVNAVDPIQKFEACPLKLMTHKRKRCPMHASLNEAAEKVEQVLSGYTIADLLKDKSRPTPMADTTRDSSRYRSSI
ncbi:RrF2 family transcriptional regulator [Adhaeretor mobilis]|uniref:HTH-type transcriptional regulator IscR n=1 Tax=Adhaeretor mobilis TaxID=1930276 RepID=A0A517MRS4_9BACT|nr:Rrf2 family transcriptional regulator [Adhaeretor mobilis]QDS97574.1 HTH-type transcriptional regulator IscR [Adhaeretor mobilis]